VTYPKLVQAITGIFRKFRKKDLKLGHILNAVSALPQPSSAAHSSPNASMN
jgi:hypothetical protein